MKGNRARQLEEDRKLVRENQHLLPPEERDRAEDLLEEDEILKEPESKEEQSGVSTEQEISAKEERAKLAIREAEVQNSGRSAPSRPKGRRIIVGHGPEMDVDG